MIFFVTWMKLQLLIDTWERHWVSFWWRGPTRDTVGWSRWTTGPRTLQYIAFKYCTQKYFTYKYCIHKYITNNDPVYGTHAFLSFVYCYDDPDGGFTFEGSLQFPWAWWSPWLSPPRPATQYIVLHIFFNFASPLLWTFGFPTCLYSNNMRNIVNITANNILDCVTPAPVENCGTIWEGGRRAVPWVTCNRIHFI